GSCAHHANTHRCKHKHTYTHTCTHTHTHTQTPQPLTFSSSHKRSSANMETEVCERCAHVLNKTTHFMKRQTVCRRHKDQRFPERERKRERTAGQAGEL